MSATGQPWVNGTERRCNSSPGLYDNIRMWSSYEVIAQQLIQLGETRNLEQRLLQEPHSLATVPYMGFLKHKVLEILVLPTNLFKLGKRRTLQQALL